MAAPKKPSLEALQRELAEMKMKLEIAHQLSSLQPQNPHRAFVSSQPQVGIRNISSYTVGLVSPVQGEVDVQLLPDDPTNRTALSTAVISYTHWQQLRRSKHVNNGVIVRDDSILNEEYIRGPEDGPSDVSETAVVNQVFNPAEWIESKDEEALREAILALKAEAPLHRLQAEVNRKIREVGMRWEGKPERAKQALLHLPSKYHLVDKLVTEQLGEISPFAKYREGRERETVKF